MLVKRVWHPVYLDAHVLRSRCLTCAVLLCAPRNKRFKYHCYPFRLVCWFNILSRNCMFGCACLLLIVWLLCIYVCYPGLSIAKNMPPKRKRVQAHPKNKRNRDSMATDNGVNSGPALVVHSAASIDQLRSLPARALRSQLLAHSSPTTGNKAAVAKRLYINRFQWRERGGDTSPENSYVVAKQQQRRILCHLQITEFSCPSYLQTNWQTFFVILHQLRRAPLWKQVWLPLQL